MQLSNNTEISFNVLDDKKTSKLNSIESINYSLILENHRSLETDVFLFNYDLDSVFIESIKKEMKKSFRISNGNNIYDYIMKYNIIYPNESALNSFNSFIESISTPNSKTVDINQTALEYQAVNNTVQDIFYEKIGTSINGTAVDNWLFDNYYSNKINSSTYQIFLFNLTFLDEIYWFNIPEIDEITNKQRTWWRLEWDFPATDTINNYDAKFPYPGYSSEYPLYFLDPSAFNWYLNWTRIWRNVPDTYDYRYYKSTFSNYLKNIGGLTTDVNKQHAGSFIGKWLNEIIVNTFIINPIPGSQFISPESLKIQLAVLTDETENNSYPDLEWIINENIAKNSLNDILPNSEISIETNYYRIIDYPEVVTLLNLDTIKNSDPFGLKDAPISNFTFYNGQILFNSIKKLDSIFFNLSGSEKTIRGYILIMDNASFKGNVNWNGGGLFTGLGGSDRLLILNEIDRLYFNRTLNPIKKSSISKVLVHEAGHAIGFPHPFNDLQNKYASDFIGETLGYFSDTTKFSELFKTNYQRLIIESRIDTVIFDIKNLVNLTFETNITIQEKFNNLLQYYRNLNFLKVNETIFELEMIVKLYKSERVDFTGPIINESPKNTVVYLGNSITLFWKAYDKNPNNFEIFVNGTTKSTGIWVNNERISYNFYPIDQSNYNITINIFDLYNQKITNSVLIVVLNLDPFPSSSKNPSDDIHNTNTTSFPLFNSFSLILLSLFIIYKKRYLKI